LLSLGIQVTQSLDTGPEVVEICPELWYEALCL
jgi:hypothetical protein